jgi:hypothetical protein
MEPKHQKIALACVVLASVVGLLVVSLPLADFQLFLSFRPILSCVAFTFLNLFFLLTICNIALASLFI